MMEQHFYAKKQKTVIPNSMFSKKPIQKRRKKKKPDICGKKQMLTEFTVTRPHLGLKEAEKSKI